MTTTTKSFIIVDDDRQNNFLTEMALRKAFEAVEVTVFMIPELALEYIEEIFQKATNQKATIILDINMPTMSGWEFIEKFKTLEESIKEQFNIYMLSSSIDPVDINRVELNPLIIDLIEKPLNKITAKEMFG
ncbi:two-component system response regulator [Flavobacterium sp.]|uniref:response regulator n=1 Tax=Flavobacterium sp. TaxID=239 RepID=UPI00391B87B9